MKENKCLNHGLDRLKNFTDLKSLQSKNPCYSSNLCHLSNPRKSVIQTTISENYKELAI